MGGLAELREGVARAGRVRYNLVLPAKSDRILDELARKDGVPKAEIVRRALALYHYVHKEVIEKELKLLIGDKNRNVEKEIVFAE